MAYTSDAGTGASDYMDEDGSNSSSPEGSRSCGPSLEEALEDVASRFLLNMPSGEKPSVERVFMQIQQAHWFYVDFYSDKYSNLPHLGSKQFAKRLFEQFKLLSSYKHQVEAFRKIFKQYLSKVPVYGAMLLNSACTKVVMVQSYNSGGWTFPRGKINQGEQELACAVREVAEEIGFDASDLANDQDFVSLQLNDKIVKLFIVQDVPEEFPFVTQTRKEIGAIEWFMIDSLPVTKSQKTKAVTAPPRGRGQPQFVNPKNFWDVRPFVARLRKWIDRRKHKRRSKSGRRAKAARAKAAAAAVTRAKGRSGRAGGAGAAAGGRRKRTGTVQMSVAAGGGGGGGAGGGAGRSADATARGAASEDDVTFGLGASRDSFSVEEMFAVNAKLTGQTYTYDGNPQSFGMVTAPCVPGRSAHRSDGEAAWESLTLEASMGRSSGPQQQAQQQAQRGGGKKRGGKKRGGRKGGASSSKRANGMVSDDEAFGLGASNASFSVEDMFATNERLTGRKFTYMGDADGFGQPDSTDAPPSPASVDKVLALPPVPRASVPRGKRGGSKRRGGRKAQASGSSAGAGAGAGAGTGAGAGAGGLTSDDETFGVGASNESWTVEAMFAANERLLGRKFTYMGDPQTFGLVSVPAGAQGPEGRSQSAGATAPPPPPPSTAKDCGLFGNFAFDTSAIMAAMDTALDRIDEAA